MNHVLPIQNVDDGRVNLEEELEKLIDNEPQSGPADVDLQGPSNLTPLPSPLPSTTPSGADTRLTQGLLNPTGVESSGVDSRACGWVKLLGAPHKDEGAFNNILK